MALAVVTGNLWAITFAWHIFDLERLLDPSSTLSEKNVWVLALSGLIFLYFLVVAIAAAWGFILGIPTCLLAVNLGLLRYKPLHRWLISGATTAALFVALNHYGMARFGLSHKKADKVATQNAAPNAMPPTLRDLDPTLPPVPLNQLSREEALKTLANAAEARCATVKDPVLIDACAKQKEAYQVQLEMGKVR